MRKFLPLVALVSALFSLFMLKHRQWMKINAVMEPLTNAIMKVIFFKSHSRRDGAFV